MKILLYSDVHWNTTSSLVRAQGSKYTVRLEHLIDSMNWVNKIAVENNCDFMICAGDFFDKSVGNDIEISALREINWNNLACYFLCGNHESSVADLRYNMLKALESDNHIIYNEVAVLNLPTCDLLFLPYAVESDRKNLKEYKDTVNDKLTGKPIVVISHNEIAGINYGGYESKIGFSLTEIKSECRLFLNGHLHNSEWVSENALNVGSFSAHNFTNDSFSYKYGVWILDTDTFELKFIENPFSFNFYKLEICSVADLKKLNKIKDNSVLSIKCLDTLILQIKDCLADLADRIVECRLTQVKAGTGTESEVSIADLQVDHLAKFIEFCRGTIANSGLLEEELSQICK